MLTRWKLIFGHSLRLETTVRVASVDRIEINGKAYVVELSITPEKTQ
jgi:hypothetical protein